MNNRDALYLAVRYGVLVLIGVFLSWFYYLFSPLTVYPVYWILKLISSSARMFVEGNVIFFKGEDIEIIDACVAGAAYYLLLILNLSTPMKKTKRILSILFLMAIFLLINIIRIVVFSLLWTSGFEYFDLAHKITWYFGSSMLVVGLWFFNVWLFKIKEIPVYSDVKSLFYDAFLSKNKKD